MAYTQIHVFVGCNISVFGVSVWSNHSPPFIRHAGSTLGTVMDDRLRHIMQQRVCWCAELVDKDGSLT